MLTTTVSSRQSGGTGRIGGRFPREDDGQMSGGHREKAWG